MRRLRKPPPPARMRSFCKARRYLYHFADYETLRKTICAYIDFYNNDRYQKKLGCMTPAEFIAASAK